MSMHWALLIAVAFGSAIGGVARFLIREYLPLWLNVDFPIGTLTVNVIGCLLAGVLMSYWQAVIVSPVFKAAILVGFLGALTTFSSFSVDTLALVQEQNYAKAGLNIFVNMTFSLIAVFFGAWIGGKLAPN